MLSRRLPALPLALIAVALIVNACDVFTTTTSPLATVGPTAGSSLGPVASGSPVVDASAAVQSPTASLVQTATPLPTPRPTPNVCTPQAPTELSKDWKTLSAKEGDFTFKYPKEWENLYGAFLFRAEQLLDPQTLGETGLPGDHPVKADLVRTPETGIPNASVLIVPGVLSSAADIYFRQELRFREIASAEFRRTDIEACLDGLTAYGVEFVFGPDATLQQSFYVVHNGRSYDFQWLATKAKPDAPIFIEMMRTWKWTPDFPEATPRPTQAATSAPSGSAFVAAGMAATITPNAPQADTSTFRTVLSKDLTSIYAVFVLRAGLTGRVEGDLLRGDEVLASLELDYAPNHTWGDFRINSSSGFAPSADYRVRIRYVPTGEEIVLPFTVE